MITNPQNIFEQAQNDLAAKLLTVAPFNAIKMPDGANFDALTEDEGDPEMLFTAMIAKCGLCVIVQSPTGKIARDEQMGTAQFNPFVIAVSVSEAILFNRSDSGTKVRLMVAVESRSENAACLRGAVFETENLRDPNAKGPRYAAWHRRAGREPHHHFRSHRSLCRSRMSSTIKPNQKKKEQS